MYIGHARLCLSVCLSVCLCVCPSPHAHTSARIRMSLGGIVGGAPSFAVLGGFVIGALVSLL